MKTRRAGVARREWLNFKDSFAPVSQQGKTTVLQKSD